MDFIKEAWNLKIGRKRYILSIIALSVFIFAAALIFGRLLKIDSMFLFSYALVMVANVFIIKQRLNDLGKSAWYVLLMAIPIVNMFMFLYLVSTPGKAIGDTATLQQDK